MSKDKYKISNWSAYNKSLENRGRINVWISADLIAEWQVLYKEDAVKLKGGQLFYSEAAILFCLTIKYVYKLPYRGGRGFVSSLFDLMKLTLPVPSYSQVCKRAKTLNFGSLVSSEKKIVDISLDSTGLKVYGEGEWKVRKHGAGKHRTWMKLHLAVDVDTQEVVALELTGNDVDDAECVSPVLASVIQSGRSINSFRGDGAYDKKKVRQQLHGKGIKQIIPPQNNAVTSKNKQPFLVERDVAIGRIKETGRKEWKIEAGYHKRSLSETSMFRFKTIHGGKLCSRTKENQITEVKIKCKVLNVFINQAKPNSYKVA